MTKPTYPGQPGNLIATPSEVNPGSSIEATPPYGPNPAPSPNQDENVGRGIPAKADFISMGAILMQSCFVCGRAYAPDEFGEHVQSHNESPYMREGTDFGNRDADNLEDPNQQ